MPFRWLIWAGLASSVCAANVSQCEKLENDNETCILAEFECEVDWPGELVIPEKRNMVCPHIIYTADRFVLRKEAALFARDNVKILARTMVLTSGFMHSNATFLLEKEGFSCGGIQMADMAILAEKQIVITCHDGTVNVTGKSLIQAQKGELQGSDQVGVLYMLGNLLSLPDFMTKLRSFRINLRAQQITLAASIGRGAHLTAMSQHEAILGWLGGSWSLASLVTAAEHVILAADHRVEVLGNSCDNKEMRQRANPCDSWLSAWPWSEMTVHEALTKLPYVKFTSVIFASKSLEMKPRTRILTGSAMFCAGEEIILSEKASVLSQGKGCPANKGDGAGEVRTHFALCGGGGASNLGAGGDGAMRMEGEASMWHCAEKGLITHWDGRSLPLQGASGGGFPKGQRSDLDFSSGGGLLWFCTSLLYMNASRLRADGMHGAMVGPSPKRAVTSGGGAGGQILIFTKEIRVECVDTDCDQPELSAQGGCAHCNSAQPTVGGAGGGGFIGLWWLGGAPTAHDDLGQLVKLEVEGGKLTKSCADFLPQDLHREVFGRPGLAVSLAPCPSGHAGPFCASCPMGFWGDGQACHECHNKPNTANAIYKSPAWPNATCPFECAQGVPEVAVNPNCLSAYDFAMGFFGGKLGFQITLAIPITIFFILRLVQWLRRQGKRKRKSFRWQFPREELPCHVARIFFLGNNSPGSPWTLPERTVALDGVERAGAELLQQVLQEEVWQLLGEALQKPLKIRRWESWHLLHLSPWFELLLLRCRLQRAQQAQQAVAQFTGEMWKEMQSHKFSMKFGCDDSATTGHLDFFDFNRSALDWAPRNLKEEEQVILAQGAGTWARPYELSVADPVLLAVAQSQGSQGPIGGQMIYSLVCAFNLFSRIVPAQELLDVLWGDEAPAFAVLQREVESSARRLSLQAAAQVQILQMSRCRKGLLEEGKKSDGTPARPESFTDLVQQLPLEGAPKDAGCADIVEEELRLCLVLRAEKDSRLLRAGESRLKKPKGFFYTIRRSFLRFRSQRLLACVRLPAGRFGISNLVLSLVFFMLILFEGMATVIVASTFSRLDIDQALWLWLMFPAPLAPLSSLMGLAALLLRWPKLCRLQAQMSLMAALNTAVVGMFFREEGLLLPAALLFVLHVFVSYSAAIYSGLEMSTEDVQLAEDRGGDASMQSLRSTAAAGRSERGTHRASLAPGPEATERDEEGICMALWPRSRTARPHADSADSDVAPAAEASPF